MGGKNHDAVTCKRYKFWFVQIQYGSWILSGTTYEPTWSTEHSFTWNKATAVGNDFKSKW